MQKILIFGNTSLAEYIYLNFKKNKNYKICGFTVDSKYKASSFLRGLKVYDFEKIINTHSPKKYKLFLAIGPSKMNSLREKKFNECKEKGYNLVSFISENAICETKVGENCFVADMTIINPFVEIGNNNFIWENCYIGHNSKINDHCYISPKASIGSYSVIKNNSIIGTSSIIKTKTIIEKKTLIGAGCYISQNTSINSVYGRKNSKFYGNVSKKIDISN